MCIVSTPKVSATSAAAKTPEPTVIRNQYLDNVDPVTSSLRRGRSSLRIERAGGPASSSRPPATAIIPPSSSAPGLPLVSPALPKITPVQGGGGAGGLTSSMKLVRTANS